MAKLKLLHVTSSLKMGGAEAVLCDLIAGLGTDQFEHHVICFHDGPRAQTLRNLGVLLHQVRGAVRLYDPVFFVRLFKTIKKLGPDCIHSLLWSANVTSRPIAKMLSIPHVSVYHNNIDQDGKFRNIFDRLTRKCSGKLVAVSDQVAQSLRATDLRLKNSDIMVIRNGIDAVGVRAKVVASAVTRADLGLAPDHFVVGSVGRFCPVKNYPLLLESFSRLASEVSNARLVLLGLGPDEQFLRERARELGIAAKTIFVIGKPACDYLGLFDCFVQPSDKEGVSMALLEALSCSIACVVASVDEKHPVICADRNGIVFPAGDIDGLVGQLLALVKNRELASAVGASGKVMVEQGFGRAGMVESYRDLFFNVTKRK